MRTSFMIVFVTGMLALGSSPVSAQTDSAQTDSTQIAADSSSGRKLSWSLIPIVFSSPDTDWAFGVLPQVVFSIPGSTRRSRVYVAAYYTLNKQYAVSSAGSFWFNENRDNIEASAQIKYWPTTYYGLESEESKGDTVDYVERTVGLSLSANRQFGPQIRLGIKGAVQRIRILDFDSDIDGSEPRKEPGSAGGWIVGVGPSIGVDTRDQVFYPTRGWYANLSFIATGYLLGGDYDFTSVKGDARTYFHVKGNQVIAVQALFDFNSRDVPFWSMKGIGSVVRGFSSMRFLDRNMIAAQVEYRVHPVFWRLGFAGFAGAGVTSGSLGDLVSSPLRMAAGIGIRIAFMPADQINIRWDFGWGEGTSGDYLEMGEAF